MAARKIPTYEVVQGCIQEGREVFDLGSEYSPPTAELEAHLLEQGVIARARPKAKTPTPVDSTTEDDAPPPDSTEDTDPPPASPEGGDGEPSTTEPPTPES